MKENVTNVGFIGIDVGTQGVRLILVNQKGEELFSAKENLLLTDQSREEQSPKEWWEASLRLLLSMGEHISKELKAGFIIRAVAVTSTSGTVIPINKHHQPIHPAIMYSDQRSSACSEKVKEIAERYFPERTGYTNFNSSSGLSKINWYLENYPTKVDEIYKWIHAADYITGQLCGSFSDTDYTNALKTGYDVKNKEWPHYVHTELPIKKEWLQEVVPTGTPVGLMKKELIQHFKLNANIKVVVGLTDGCASQIASGAVDLGDWNTTIGTTLVIKGITHNEVFDPEGRIYSHRHPQGYWMPGGASNSGADWTNSFSTEAIVEYTKNGDSLLPTGQLSYPLLTKGERFPFIATHARGFEAAGLSPIEAFIAKMEGLAYIERYAYELIENLSGEKIRTVFTAGGASNNKLWMKIRANVMNLPVKKMKNVSGAMGAAIVASSQTFYSNLIEAGVNMIQSETEYYPDEGLSLLYNDTYKKFIALLKSKNYINE